MCVAAQQRDERCQGRSLPGPGEPSRTLQLESAALGTILSALVLALHGLCGTYKADPVTFEPMSLERLGGFLLLAREAEAIGSQLQDTGRDLARYAESIYREQEDTSIGRIPGPAGVKSYDAYRGRIASRLGSAGRGGFVTTAETAGRTTDRETLLRVGPMPKLAAPPPVLVVLDAQDAELRRRLAAQASDDAMALARAYLDEANALLRETENPPTFTLIQGGQDAA